MSVWRSEIIHFQRFPAAFIWVLGLDSYTQGVLSPAQRGETEAGQECHKCYKTRCWLRPPRIETNSQSLIVPRFGGYSMYFPVGVTTWQLVGEQEPHVTLLNQGPCLGTFFENPACAPFRSPRDPFSLAK